MSNPLLARPETVYADNASVRAFLDYDDDDEATDDDDDELAASSAERWFTSSGFGSPQWWSRH
jgi:hypothetical protein